MGNPKLDQNNWKELTAFYAYVIVDKMKYTLYRYSMHAMNFLHQKWEEVHMTCIYAFNSRALMNIVLEAQTQTTASYSHLLQNYEDPVIKFKTISSHRWASGIWMRPSTPASIYGSPLNNQATYSLLKMKVLCSNSRNTINASLATGSPFDMKLFKPSPCSLPQNLSSLGWVEWKNEW